MLQTKIFKHLITSLVFTILCTGTFFTSAIAQSSQNGNAVLNKLQGKWRIVSLTPTEKDFATRALAKLKTKLKKIPDYIVNDPELLEEPEFIVVSDKKITILDSSGSMGIPVLMVEKNRLYFASKAEIRQVMGTTDFNETNIFAQFMPLYMNVKFDSKDRATLTTNYFKLYGGSRVYKLERVK